MLFLPPLPVPLSAGRGYSVCVYVNLPRIIHRGYSAVLFVVVLSLQVLLRPTVSSLFFPSDTS